MGDETVKDKKTIIAVVLSAVALLGIGVAILMPKAEDKKAPVQMEADRKEPSKAQVKNGAQKKKTQRQRRIVPGAPGSARHALFELNREEEALLTAAQKALLEELRALSDAEDRKGLFKLIARMQSSDEWPDGIPSILHEEAIEALSWIGSEALPELVGYLGCGDDSVREEAMDALQDMLSDPDKSDRERSEMLKKALPYLNTIADLDALDDIFGDIMEMRNSVQADTLVYLLENGSENVREALKDTIEMVTGEEDSNSVEKIKEWAAQEENQDDPDDDDYYGATTNDDDTDADDTEKIENDSDFKD